jgi:GTP-binding protein
MAQMTQTQGRIPTVAIVGRPNVGKSALFNRLVGRRIALVEDLPGTTRDRLVADLDWHGRLLRLVDTGGLETSPSSTYSPLIREQIDAALRDADVIIFVVDGRDGLTAEDYEVADLLRRAIQPVILVANKVDNERRELETVQFYELGMGPAELVSAFHGYGVSDMLDAVLDRLSAPAPLAEVVAGPALAIVGRPNVGKSMLLNALLGEERVIVSEVAGTTRDAVDTQLEFEGRELTLIDTAGIRRRGHIVPGVERHSVQRAETAVERCDVALVVMDATEPVTAQDTHILQIVDEAYKGLLLVLNKTDLLVDPDAERELRRLIRYRLRFLPWAPIQFVSALRGTGLPGLLRAAMSAAEARDRRVPTGGLNTLLQRAIVQHPPRSVQGRRLKLLYATQAGVRPPTFVLFVNDTQLLHFSFERYIENRLREAYGFEGTAIRIVFKARSEESQARADDERRAAERPEPVGTSVAAATSRARPRRQATTRRRE